MLIATNSIIFVMEKKRKLPSWSADFCLFAYLFFGEINIAKSV